MYVRQVEAMQEFSLAFGRVTRAAIAANPELKNHVNDLLGRAYFNIHGAQITNADPQWIASIHGAACQLCLDARVTALSVRELVHLFENVIRISEEHLREARRHAAMASNVFYLKETALDAVLIESSDAGFNAASTRVVGVNMAHTGRIDVPKPGDSII